MTTNGTIFNVPEAQGTDLVELETTAAAAQIEAPNSNVAREVEANADHAHQAASAAAHVAQTKGPSVTGGSAVDQLQYQAQRTTDAAVAEGQYDVEAAKAAGVGYLDQAKSLASSAISTAQSYLPASVGGTTTNTTGPNTGATSSLQSGAATVIGTTKEYLAAAHETAKPYIENAKGAAQGYPGTRTVNGEPGTGVVSSLQSGAATAIGTTKEYLAAAHEAAKPHIENAKGAAQGYLGTAGVQPSTEVNPPASSTGIPATTAPLESGPHTVGTPYPSTTTGTSTKVAEVHPH